MLDLYNNYKSKITPISDAQPREGPRELSRYEESNKVNKRKKVKSELERYLTTHIEEVSDVLAWWKAHQTTYPQFNPIRLYTNPIQSNSMIELQQFNSTRGSELDQIDSGPLCFQLNALQLC
jgi:hypothetical protein